MAQKFFGEKYGSSVAYDQYLEEKNMVDLRPPVSPYEQEYEEEFDMRRHLERKAQEIREEEMGKIYGENASRGEGKVVNKRASSSAKKNNPWL